jgi:hypothetical protein
MADEVKYDAPATLYMLDTADSSGLARGGPVWQGPLADAIKKS